ncbi:hypothetical protein HYC85_029012 [Camellia sinensis]|uniref:Uncharacterized protein n=1 Tax=Camellia sinensis TaxID=4442 RepID=A0A7J7FXZ0_CAMSI|nr:hypothetical protein HYC85_029012 [Camellia sinensis]
MRRIKIPPLNAHLVINVMTTADSSPRMLYSPSNLRIIEKHEFGSSALVSYYGPCSAPKRRHFGDKK